jgi:hypothetical protein
VDGVFLRGMPAQGKRRPVLGLLLNGPQETGTGVLVGSRGEAVTVVRATTRTCLRADGVLVTVGVNLPAVEAEGLSVEAAHTNYLENSENLAAWTIRGTAAVASGITDPKGGTTAKRLSGLQAPVTGDLYTGGHGGASSGAKSLSLWIKRVSTSGSLGLVTANGNPGEWSVNLALLPDAWVRVTAAHAAVTVTTPFTGNQNGGLVIYRAAGASPLSSDVWGLQYEDGAVARSYVGPTTTSAVTCAKDVVTMSPASLPVAAGRMELDFTPLWSSAPGSGATLVDTSADTTGWDGVSVFVNAGGTLSARLGELGGAGSSTVITSAVLTWAAGTTYRISVRWGLGNLTLTRDGVIVASLLDGTALIPTVHPTLRLGDGFLATSPMDGHLKNLRFTR